MAKAGKLESDYVCFVAGTFCFLCWPVFNVYWCRQNKACGWQEIISFILRHLVRWTRCLCYL